MPPISLPPGVPLGLWWYVLWISINGLLIYILRLVRDPGGQLQQNARRESERQLPSLNEYLWRLVTESESGNDPYDGPLESADDLSKLLKRARNANKSILRYDRLRRHTGFGNLASSCAILGALICGGLYLLKYPSLGVASLIGIVGFSVFTLWSLWHVVNSLTYYFLIVRVSNEED